MEEKFIADLKGFSGCKLKLYSRDGELFVRKISKSPDYNERLKSQMVKQQYFFNNLATEQVSAPRVLGSGFLEDCFFFDMEYINGVNLAIYLSSATIDELNFISQQLVSILTLMKSQQREAKAKVFSKSQEKIKQIHAKMQERLSDTGLLTVLGEMEAMAQQCVSSDDPKETFCHGDLTMDNILYDKEHMKFYLIDFLDSYADHYWLDIAKLFQDIEGGWYKFRNPDLDMTNTFLKMAFVENYLNKNVVFKERGYAAYHYLFLALVFARILPYAEEQDFDYLIGNIKLFVSKYKEQQAQEPASRQAAESRRD